MRLQVGAQLVAWREDMATFELEGEGRRPGPTLSTARDLLPTGAKRPQPARGFAASLQFLLPGARLLPDGDRSTFANMKNELLPSLSPQP